VAPAHARALDGRTTAIAFQPRPYETFDESADVFGDGSVVVVKLPGHTPGSVGVFVNVSPTLRMFHVGDAVNVVEAVERRLTKSVVMAPTDEAPEEAEPTCAWCWIGTPEGSPGNRARRYSRLPRLSLRGGPERDGPRVDRRVHSPLMDASPLERSLSPSR
jgi:hypothetical protein